MSVDAQCALSAAIVSSLPEHDHAFLKPAGIGIGVLVAVAIWLAPMPEGPSLLGYRALILFGCIFFLYLTEALPISVVSLLVVPATALSWISTVNGTLEGLSTYLIVGAFVLVPPMVRTRLAEGITYLILLRIGSLSRFLRATALATFGLPCCLPVSASDLLPANLAKSAPARHASFFVGGRYEGLPGQEVMQGAVSVEMFMPEAVKKPWPLVLFHGAAQTSANWLGTPDGRTGWADFFVRQGYVVYLVDQPARGRSAYHPALDGPIRSFPAPVIERLFTASAQLGTWPQAKRHTQWPGSGRMGDAVFDAYYRTQVEFLVSNADTQKLVQTAGAALLDQIGPSVLVTHSQAGAFGWLIADVRPDLVKTIVALEPLGPPFQDAVLGTAPARPWGVTDIPMTYDPPLAQASELSTTRQKTPEAPSLEACWLQAEPARRLPRLHNIPILIVATEASYHAVYDHCTARYLSQAGATVDFQRLEDHGIRGNGHMFMLEKNSDEIAGFVSDWMTRHVPRP